MWWAELKTGWTMHLRSLVADKIAKSLVDSGLAVSACGNPRVRPTGYRVGELHPNHYEQGVPCDHVYGTVNPAGKAELHGANATQFLHQAVQGERMVADIFARGTYEFECTKCGTAIKGSANSIYPCNTIKVGSVKCPNEECDASYTVEMSL